MSEFSDDLTYDPTQYASPRYTGFRGVPAEGARIGLLTCLQCGATVTIDPSDEVSATKIHDEWHDETPKDGSTP